MLVRYLLIVALIFSVLLVVVTGVAVYRLMAPVGQGRVEITIPKGADVAEIGSILSSEDLVPSAWEFVAWSRILGFDRKLKAAKYSIQTPVSMKRIFSVLAEGTPGPEIEVTIPEGCDIREIAEIVFGDDREQLKRFENEAFEPDSDMLGIIGRKSGSLEGYLFPDTYRFAVPLEPHAVIMSMLENWTQKITPAMKSRADSLGLDIHGIMTLASIIEKETGLDGERAKVSAVYWNRMKNGWKLEADPTVAYFVGKKGTEITRRDLKKASPYNTYMNRGLPPGPVCNPGLASIEAALFPDEDCKAFYFVAAGEGGGHVFSRTLKEHVKAVKNYRKNIMEKRSIK